MPLSNKYVRYCHTNIGNCSFNGAFSLYTADILKKFIIMQNAKILVHYIHTSILREVIFQMNTFN